MKVLIIGAGIGGLTAAIALQQEGLEYEIFDAAPGNSVVGAGIVLGVNAMRVYRELGISGLIAARAQRPEIVDIRNSKGKILQTISNIALESKYGIGAYGLHRASLQDILLGQVMNAVQYSKRCQHISEDDNGVTVHFDDGSSAIGTIAIGADGIRSVVRERYIGQAQYRYSGQTCWRAIVPFELPEKEKAFASEIWSVRGKGLRAMFMQIEPRQVYFWMSKAMPAGNTLSNIEALSLIRAELKDFSGYMQSFLPHLEPEHLIPGDLYDLAPLQQWYKGRMVLLGDAAHATTPNIGQGAAQAIEDAYVLAKALSPLQHKHNVTLKNYTAAFKAYQERRLKRAHKIVGISWQLAMITNLRGKFLTSIRDVSMQMIPKQVMDKQTEFLYGVDLA